MSPRITNSRYIDSQLSKLSQLTDTQIALESRCCQESKPPHELQTPKCRLTRKASPNSVTPYQHKLYSSTTHSDSGYGEIHQREIFSDSIQCVVFLSRGSLTRVGIGRSRVRSLRSAYALILVSIFLVSNLQVSTNRRTPTTVVQYIIINQTKIIEPILIYHVEIKVLLLVFARERPSGELQPRQMSLDPSTSSSSATSPSLEVPLVRRPITANISKTRKSKPKVRTGCLTCKFVLAYQPLEGSTLTLHQSSTSQMRRRETSLQ